MATLTLPRGQTALLLMDFQNDIVHPEGKIGRVGPAAQVEARGVLEHAARLRRAARQAGVPVIHVRVAFRPDYADLLSGSPRFQQLRDGGALQDGTWGAQIHEALTPAADEVVVTKHCVNPFYGTALGPLLLRLGVRCLLLCGVATNFVVESAARYAADAGYQVVVVPEGCAAAAEEMHRWSLERLLPAFGTVAGIDEVAAALGA
jgi:biuret amidohydrolase